MTHVSVTQPPSHMLDLSLSLSYSCVTYFPCTQSVSQISEREKEIP